ncbi:MAG: T9SS C-terminal target domain-containing protein [Bacteroidetes bacterium]|nr:MAG: T9SS C-terminal target domain-containing protein [Bacteroidota bacterium]
MPPFHQGRLSFMGKNAKFGVTSFAIPFTICCSYMPLRLVGVNMSHCKPNLLSSMNKPIILAAGCLLLMLMCMRLQGQTGCTDPQAGNYDPQAVQNDGSCTYPFTQYQLSTEARLALKENSGLLWAGEQLWTQLDSGGPNELYQINPETGAVVKRVVIANAENVDWEDLASDGEYVYVGDFGNNQGTRTDLAVYKLSMAGLLAAADGDSLQADLIAFSYKDQNSFEPQQGQTAYDCEAFFAHGDSLHVFTKNWAQNATSHYVLPTQPGVYEIEAVEQLQTGMLVTAADINPAGKEAVLIGYNLSFTDFNAYMWVLSDFQPGRFFSGNKRKISLGSLLSNGQIEAVAYKTKDEGYISAEELSQPPITIPASLYTFSTAAWQSEPTSIAGPHGNELFAFYPNPATDVLYLTARRAGRYELLNLIGQQVLQGNLLPDVQQRQDLRQLRRGVYLLRIQDGHASHTFRLILK